MHLRVQEQTHLAEVLTSETAAGVYLLVLSQKHQDFLERQAIDYIPYIEYILHRLYPDVQREWEYP